MLLNVTGFGLSIFASWQPSFIHSGHRSGDNVTRIFFRHLRFLVFSEAITAMAGTETASSTAIRRSRNCGGSEFGLFLLTRAILAA